jgi:hypothetical protein
MATWNSTSTYPKFSFVPRNFTAKQYSAFFIVKLIIETYSQGLYSRDNNGMITLQHVVDRPCIDCFRAVLYSGTTCPMATKD